LSQPLVSVIVPVFNTRPFLQQCLDSLFTQSLREMEIICVDNGSTDGSYEFLQEYSNRHLSVIVIRHTGGRQGGARNAGISQARGDYIGFVDSDDFVLPDMFRKMYIIADNKDAEVVECNYELFSGKASKGQALPGDFLTDFKPISILEKPRLLRNLTPWNKIYSRDLIERYALRFPESLYHEDQFFVIAALILARHIATVPDSFYRYRRGRRGSVNRYRGADSLHIFKVMKLVSDFLESQGVDGEYKDLVNEAKALKYPQLYRTTQRKFKRAYFELMHKEFLDIELPSRPRILSLAERREFQFAQKYGHSQFDLFLELRALYRFFRRASCGMRWDYI
jgi:glycosyltransferase involved in cell wall biosynthesis